MLRSLLAPAAFAVLGVAAVGIPNAGEAAMMLCPAPGLENGNYTNADLDTRSITRATLEFRCAPTSERNDDGTTTATHGADPHFRVRLWGSCSPTDCDWGTAKAEPTGEGVWEAQYDQGFAQRRVEIHRLDDDRFRLVIHSSYEDDRADRTSKNVMHHAHSIVISSADIPGATKYTISNAGRLEQVDGELDGHEVTIQDNDEVSGHEAEGHVSTGHDGFLALGDVPDISLENPGNAVVYINGERR